MKPILRILGSGMGNLTLYSKQAVDILKRSKRTLSTERISKYLTPELDNIEVLSVSGILNALDNNTEDIAVVVSGDCGFYSFAQSLVEQFDDKYEIKSYPGISSMQYLLAKINKSYHDVVSISLHGRTGNPIAAICYNLKVFILTDKTNNTNKILADINTSGLAGLTITVAENLSDSNERITTGTTEELIQNNFESLSVIYIENANFTNNAIRLQDKDFVRNKTPMTKETVRTLSINKLEIQPDDIVYDIGAGTGSISVAAAYKANKGVVYAIESAPEAVDVIRQNRKKLGAFNVTVVEASAPDGLEQLPLPNKVFIGGTKGKMENIIAEIINKQKKFTLCINTIALESLNESVQLLEQYNFGDIQISCVNNAYSNKIGKYIMMKAENPIYIVSGEKNG